MNRPISFQNHIDPIPEFIIKNNLRLFPYRKDEFFDIVEGLQMVDRVSEKVYKLIPGKKK